MIGIITVTCKECNRLLNVDIGYNISWQQPHSLICKCEEVIIEWTNK